jgi:hypothetical protein
MIVGITRRRSLAKNVGLRFKVYRLPWMPFDMRRWSLCEELAAINGSQQQGVKLPFSIYVN